MPVLTAPKPAIPAEDWSLQKDVPMFNGNFAVLSFAPTHRPARAELEALAPEIDATLAEFHSGETFSQLVNLLEMLTAVESDLETSSQQIESIEAQQIDLARAGKIDDALEGKLTDLRSNRAASARRRDLLIDALKAQHAAATAAEIAARKSAILLANELGQAEFGYIAKEIDAVMGPLLNRLVAANWRRNLNPAAAASLGSDPTTMTPDGRRALLARLQSALGEQLPHVRHRH